MLYSLFVMLLLYSAVLGSVFKSLGNISLDGYYIVKRKWLYFTVISFALIVGLRWDVGTDFMTYHYIYTENGLYGDRERLELIPRLLMDLGNSFSLGSSFWFIIMAAIQISFIIIGCKRQFAQYLPFILLLYLIFFLGHDMNLVRQSAAYSIVFCSFCLLQRDTIKYSLLLLVIAFFFHKSAIIAFPLVLTKFIKVMPSSLIQISIYIVAGFIGTFWIQSFLPKILPIFVYLDAQNIFDRVTANELQNQVSSGLGVIFRDIICITIICNYKNIIAKYPNKIYMYFIFFIGSCTYRMFMGEQYLLRINQYFSIFTILFGGITIYELLSSSKKIVAFILIVFALIIATFNAINTNWSFISNLL